MKGSKRGHHEVHQTRANIRHTPWNFVQGVGGRILEIIQVCDPYILIVHDKSPIYVKPLNEWQILELGIFEVEPG